MEYLLGLSIALTILAVTRLILDIYEEKLEKQLIKEEYEKLEKMINAQTINKVLEKVRVIENAIICSDRKSNKR